MTLLRSEVMLISFFKLPFLSGDNSDTVPPDSISNSEVKRISGDGSVGFPYARVAHRQTPILKSPHQLMRAFCYVANHYVYRSMLERTEFVSNFYTLFDKLRIDDILRMDKIKGPYNAPNNPTTQQLNNSTTQQVFLLKINKKFTSFVCLVFLLFNCKANAFDPFNETPPDFGIDEPIYGFNTSGLSSGIILSIRSFGFEEAATEAIEVRGTRPRIDADEEIRRLMMLEERAKALESTIIRQQIMMDHMQLRIDTEIAARIAADKAAESERCKLALAIGVVQCDNLRQDVVANQVNCAGIGGLSSIAYNRALSGGGRYLLAAEFGALVTNICGYIQGDDADDAHFECLFDLNNEARNADC